MKPITLAVVYFCCLFAHIPETGLVKHYKEGPARRTYFYSEVRKMKGDKKKELKSKMTGKIETWALNHATENLGYMR